MALKKSERKLQIREEARRKVKGPGGGVLGTREYRERVEKGRRELLQKGAEGDDTAAQQAKSELIYLIRNYLPAYESRIETLIDQWRRSGDPSYDPGIRIELRKARQEHMKQHPF